MRRLGVDLDLWSSDTGETLAADLPVVRFTAGEAFEPFLREYDTVLYSIGDSLTFHKDVLTMARRIPGVIVLHDFVVHHLVVAWYFQAASGIPRYLDAVEYWYGAEVRDQAAAEFAHSDGNWKVRGNGPHLWESDRVLLYPLFEDVLMKATGVVVHSDFLRARVSAATEVPVCHLPLPMIRRASRPRDRDQAEPTPPVVPDERVVLLTVGHLNPNKRVLEVIDVLGHHRDLAARVVYVVIGSQQDAQHTRDVRDAIARHGLQGSVRLIGRCSDQDLHAWLARADVCVTLRHPVMEGASLSLVEQMAAGKAVIVTNDGVYAEAPDDAVRKVSPGAEAAELPGVLRNLVDDPDGRRRLGERARQHAEAVHRADRYAAELIAFLRRTWGVTAMARYVDRVGTALRQVGARPGMPIVDRVARETATLFGEPETSPWKPGE
jgi:glycosyltransferase involved in cell wall biosynthesis